MTAQEEQERAYKQTEERNMKAKCQGKPKGKVAIVIKPKAMLGGMPGMIG